jgi:hypothetical protein
VSNEEYNEKMAQFIAASLTGNIARAGSWGMASLSKQLIEEAQAAMLAYEKVRR